jgi:hypothetical protein
MGTPSLRAARAQRATRWGALVCTGPSAALANPLAWQLLLTQLRAQAWYVYAKAPFAGPRQVLNYLARYTHRIAISNERIVDVADDQVRFRYKDYAAGSVMKEMRLDAPEFLRRFLALLNAPAPPKKPAVAPSPAERILQLTGIDILRCPVCGEGPMRRIERLPPDTSCPARRASRRPARPTALAPIHARTGR